MAPLGNRFLSNSRRPVPLKASLGLRTMPLEKPHRPLASIATAPDRGPSELPVEFRAFGGARQPSPQKQNETGRGRKALPARGRKAGTTK